MIIDTHCHLTMMGKKRDQDLLRDEDFRAIAEVLDESKKNGVGIIITIATTLADSLQSIRISQMFDNVSASVGIHPCDVTTSWQKDFAAIKKLLEKKEEYSIVGIGETGLDFFHKPFYKQRQIDAFKAQIEASIEHRLPLVIHMRDSAQEALRVLEEYKDEAFGIAHCFLQTKDIADILNDWGFALGIGGPITYPKNEWVREVFREVSLDHIVLETDAPFLPPQAFRGKTNYPKYLSFTAATIAQIKEISVEEVEAQTTKNAKKVFGL